MLKKKLKNINHAYKQGWAKYVRVFQIQNTYLGTGNTKYKICIFYRV